MRNASSQEHIDYDLVESTNPAFGKAVVRVNVYRSHRQTVQYIQPQHHAKLAQVGGRRTPRAAHVFTAAQRDRQPPWHRP